MICEARVELYGDSDIDMHIVAGIFMVQILPGVKRVSENERNQPPPSSNVSCPFSVLFWSSDWKGAACK